METLKSLSLSKCGSNIELSVQLSSGAASVTFWPHMSEAEVIQQFRGLVSLIEEGARDRANASQQLKLPVR